MGMSIPKNLLREPSVMAISTIWTVNAVTVCACEHYMWARHNIRCVKCMSHVVQRGGGKFGGGGWAFGQRDMFDSTTWPLGNN